MALLCVAAAAQADTENPAASGDADGVVGHASTQSAGALDAEQSMLVQAERRRLDALHRSGVAMMGFGMWAEAEGRLTECFRADPSNPIYRQSLIQVKRLREKAQARMAAWPLVAHAEFRGVPLGEALQNLQARSRQLDPARRGFNLVYRIPVERRAQPVTLDLKDVPLDTVIRYTCELAGVPCAIEGRTVVIGRLPSGYAIR